ncbi:MAG: hypothetical protein U0894_07400 [Pirellulales bacterium]
MPLWFSSAASRQGAVEEFYQLAIQKQMPQFALTVPPIVLLPSAGKVRSTCYRTAPWVSMMRNQHPDGGRASGRCHDRRRNQSGAGKEIAGLCCKPQPMLPWLPAPSSCVGLLKWVTPVAQAAVATVGGNLAPQQTRLAHVAGCLLVMTMAAPFEFRW